MSTISNRNDHEVIRRLENISRDNPGVAERKLAKKIRSDLLPVANKVFRTTKIPSGLDKIEAQYIERVEWPRSRYFYSVLLEACNNYRNIPDIPYVDGPELLENFNHPFTESTRFDVDLTLARNKRALKKAASLPMFGKKKDNIAAATQYVNEVLKSSSGIQDMYSIMPGYRTQQSSPDAPKVRLVWAFPVTTWLMECEAYDDGITNTIERNKQENVNIKLFYEQPENIHKWYQTNGGNVHHWVNADASSYDASVRGSELSDFIHYIAGNYEYSDKLVEYIQTAALVLPEGDLIREGGMPSGSKITNVGDGYTNICDWLETLRRTKLLRYLEAVLVNGDDISLGFSTKINVGNLEKFNRYSRRTINKDKSLTSTYVWNSKWYMDDEIMTRPLYRVINSMMFKEHQTNPITGSKEYVTLAFIQQIKDIEQHPCYPALESTLLKLNKYPLSSFSDEDIEEAASEYIDEHYNAQVFSSTNEFLDSLRQSRFVEAGG